MPASTVPPPADHFNFAQHLFDRNAGRAGKAAFVDELGSLSYGELQQRARRLASGLRSLGIRREERVLLLMLDSLDWPVAFLGAMYAGVVPVAVNTLLTADDYAYMLEHSRAQAVLVSGALLPALNGALIKSDHEVGKVIVSRPQAPLHPSEAEFEAFVAAHEPMARPAHTGPDDPGFWLYSSGSTGRPKGTVHSHGNPYWTSELYGAGVLGLREDDICFSAAKLFFAYGLGNAMTFPLWVGGTAILLAPRPTPELTFDVIRKFRPSLYFGVPTLYAAQLAAMDQNKPDFSSVRACMSAGEALPADIHRRWKAATGLGIVDGWGSTELLHIAISNTLSDQQPGKSGRPLPGYEARIVAENGQPAKPGETGALHVRGPSTARAYWNQAERTAATMLDGGWLNTGDTYYQDEKGYYVYAGRNDDMLKVGGIWTSPIEIEGRLIEHPNVLEAAIVGRADADGLVKPEAWIVLKDKAAPKGADAAALEAEFREHCKKGLAPYKSPRWFNFVSELPKTATGKIQRFKLRAG